MDYEIINGSTSFNDLFMLKFDDYVMPADLIALFADVFEKVCDNYDGTAFNYHINVHFPIDDFLRYVLTFQNISPVRKFATIYSFLVSYSDENMFDVKNNTIVYDVLTRQIEPKMHKQYNKLLDYYAFPSYASMLDNDQYHIDRLNKASIYFGYNYERNIGLLNYVLGKADSLSDGIELGFQPIIHELIPVYYDKFDEFIDFNNNGDYPVAVDNILDAWEIFCNMKLFHLFDTGHEFVDHFNKILVEWIFSHYTVRDKEVLEQDALISVCVSSDMQYHWDNVKKICERDYKMFVPWLLYLYRHVSLARFEELIYFEFFFYFIAAPENCLWLAENNHMVEDVPLSLVLEIYSNEISLNRGASIFETY